MKQNPFQAENSPLLLWLIWKKLQIKTTKKESRNGKERKQPKRREEGNNTFAFTDKQHLRSFDRLSSLPGFVQYSAASKAASGESCSLQKQWLTQGGGGSSPRTPELLSPQGFWEGASDNLHRELHPT